jgi:nicotinate-nucleotide pyrophosphorylase (carboxylating)
MWSALTLQLVDAARDEDLGPGDVTSALLPEAAREITARVVPRGPGIICGLALGPAICASFSARLGQPLQFTPTARGGRIHQDGDAVARDAAVATVCGPQAAVLAAERTMLNFLGRMSGVATLTRRFVDAARAVNPAVQILDTRKTVPGWRELDKYAVRAGGGHNHRAGLHDAILIKDNHVAGIPSDRLTLTLGEWLGQRADRAAFVEVEVDSLAQLVEVCKVPAVDMVLLDNFSLDDLRAAVAHRNRSGLRAGQGGAQRTLQIEASGGITLDDVAAVAATGVDRISVGALTHAAPALDIGLDS